MGEPHLEVEKRALRARYPEWATAEHIGEARRTLARLTPPGEELRITAYLYHLGFGKAYLAKLLGLKVSTIETRLREWRRLAEPPKTADE